MRKDGIPYVPNGRINYYPAKPLEELSLEEIKKKYIVTCGKANGNVSVCSKCLTPCREGKRAIQLVANEVYNDPPIPLYGGKTLIEKAREENIRRKKGMEERPLAEILESSTSTEEPKKKKIYWDGWWEESLKSGDQVKWVMENMNLTKAQAKKKIYQYKWAHKDTLKPVEKVKVDNPDIESKLENLLKQQEEHKKEMDKYMNLYNKAKEAYEKVKHKTDILCSAMDILND